MILVTGGSASGKSEYAEQLIAERGRGQRVYIATMRVWDEESEERIRKHRRMRRQKQFATIECYSGLDSLDLAACVPVGLTAAKDPAFSVLLECMSNLAANEIYECGGSSDEIIGRIMAGIRELKKQAETLIIVTNEVFSDDGDYDPQTRSYLNILGELNQQLAKLAGEVTEVVYGIPVTIKK